MINNFKVIERNLRKLQSLTLKKEVDHKAVYKSCKMIEASTAIIKNMAILNLHGEQEKE